MELEKKNDESNGNKTLKMYFVATIQDLDSTPYPLKETRASWDISWIWKKRWNAWKAIGAISMKAGITNTP